MQRWCSGRIQNWLYDTVDMNDMNMQTLLDLALGIPFFYIVPASITNLPVLPLVSRQQANFPISLP